MAPTPRRSRNIAIDGKKTTEARRNAGLTQLQLATKAGISQSYLSSLELGERSRMSPALYTRLCDALGVTDPSTLMAEPPTTPATP